MTVSDEHFALCKHAYDHATGVPCHPGALRAAIEKHHALHAIELRRVTDERDDAMRALRAQAEVDASPKGYTSTLEQNLAEVAAERDKLKARVRELEQDRACWKQSREQLEQEREWLQKQLAESGAPTTSCACAARDAVQRFLECIRSGAGLHFAADEAWRRLASTDLCSCGDSFTADDKRRLDAMWNAFETIADGDQRLHVAGVEPFRKAVADRRCVAAPTAGKAGG